MWTVKFVSRDNEQACVINEASEELWFTWDLVKREQNIRDAERMNATIALKACDIQDAGGCRSYLDTGRAREIAGLLVVQVDAYETTANGNNLGEAAVASCEMQDTARDLVQLAVDMRNHREGGRTYYGNAATDGRWRD